MTSIQGNIVSDASWAPRAMQSLGSDTSFSTAKTEGMTQPVDIKPGSALYDKIANAMKDSGMSVPWGQPITVYMAPAGVQILQRAEKLSQGVDKATGYPSDAGNQVYNSKYGKDDVINADNFQVK